MERSKLLPSSAITVRDESSWSSTANRARGTREELMGRGVASNSARCGTVEHVAELPFASPAFTEGITMAAQKICSELRIGQFSPVWSYLGAAE